MRFSLKWILAGMAYVAIAAAAFGTSQWYFADALSVLSLLLLIYAALIAYVARGARRLAAAGFVLGGLGFLLWLAMGKESAPVTRVLAACGIDPSSRPRSSMFKQLAVTVSALPEYAEKVVYETDDIGRKWVTYTMVERIDFRVMNRAANAVATLVFGAMGLGVGLMAYGSTAREQE